MSDTDLLTVAEAQIEELERLRACENRQTFERMG